MSDLMKAMDLSAVLIDAEMVGKLYVLACNTMSVPTNDSVENMACTLLHAAIDAALAVHDGTTDTNLENPKEVRFVFFKDAPTASPEAVADTGKQ